MCFDFVFLAAEEITRYIAFQCSDSQNNIVSYRFSPCMKFIEMEHRTHGNMRVPYENGYITTVMNICDRSKTIIVLFLEKFCLH